jgi:uncharacterized peroxidase-related enzyme
MREHGEDLRQELEAAGEPHPLDMDPRREALSTYAEKATSSPAEMTKSDLAPLRAEGLTDRDLLDLTQVIGFFNSINRIADCLGVDPEP